MKIRPGAAGGDSAMVPISSSLFCPRAHHRVTSLLKAPVSSPAWKALPRPRAGPAGGPVSVGHLVPEPRMRYDPPAMAATEMLMASERVMLSHQNEGLPQRVIGEDHAQAAPPREEDRKSTRLNSSHMSISYAVFCLKKK